MKRDYGTNGINGINGKSIKFPFVPFFPFVPSSLLIPKKVECCLDTRFPQWFEDRG
jgi:hypothetical protein